MRLVILTQYYPPETGAPQNRLHELAMRLVLSGDDVEVFTAMPNYPSMKIQEQYRGKLFCSETIDKVRVHRSWIYCSSSKALVPRLLNYFSFVFTSFWFALFKMRRSDVLICESPPLFLGKTAYVLSRIKRTPLHLNVSDLWPESAVALGLVTNKFLISISTTLEEFLYRKSTTISGQTKGICTSISTRYPNKPVYWVPNGVDVELFQPMEKSSGLREELGLKDSSFVIIYAGIIGHAQGLELLVHAAAQLKDDGVEFLLLGNGPEKEELKQLTSTLALNNVVFHDFVPKSQMKMVLSCVDASVVPLKKNDLFKGAIPSKIFENLAMKIPVLLGVEGEAYQLFVEEGKCALPFEPENVKSLTDAVLRLRNDADLRAQVGESGLSYVKAKFSREQTVRGFKSFLTDHL